MITKWVWFHHILGQLFEKQREKAESLENAEFNFLHVHVRIHVRVQVLNLSDNHIWKEKL